MRPRLSRRAARLRSRQDEATIALIRGHAQRAGAAASPAERALAAASAAPRSAAQPCPAPPHSRTRARASSVLGTLQRLPTSSLLAPYSVARGAVGRVDGTRPAGHTRTHMQL
jgi:hypothetical protein